jgi:maltose alpha-D-glucosyltransferase / alpha-amylase
MQWTSGRNGGFSPAERLVRPAIDTGPYAYDAVNVEEQARRPTSLLRWMMEMIRVRKECPEIGAGEWKILATRDRHVLALLYERRDSAVVCVHNFAEEPREVTLELGEATRLRSLLGTEDTRATSGRHSLLLEPLGYEWYRVEN